MKKLLTILLAVLMAMSALAGCTGNGSPAPQTAAPADAQASTKTEAQPAEAPTPAALSGEITFAMQEDQTTQNAWQTQMAENFMRANPGVKVNTTTYTGNYGQGLQNAFAAGQGPDVIYIGTMEAPTFINANKFEALDDYIGKDSYDISDFDKGILNAYSNGGKLYALPKDMNKLGLFYNTDIFAQAGITAPPATWDELLNVCKTLRDKLPKDKYPICIQNECNRAMAFVSTNGVWPIKADGTPAVNDPKVAEAVTFLTNLFYSSKYAVIPSDIGDGWSGDTFGQGKAAMTIEGGWLVNALATTYPETKYKVAELPYKTEKNTVVLGGAWAMSSESKNKDAAWAFLKYLTAPEIQMAAVDGLPVRMSLQANFIKAHPGFDGYTSFGPYGYGWNFGILAGTADGEFTNALSNIKSGTPVQKALDDCQKTLEQALKDVQAATKK